MPAFPAPCNPPASLPAELHGKLQSSEAEVRSRCEELSSVHGQLDEAKAQNSQLTERIRSIEALLEASQARDAQVSCTSSWERPHPPHRGPALMTCRARWSRGDLRALSLVPGQPRGGQPAAGPVRGGRGRGLGAGVPGRSPLRRPAFPHPSSDLEDEDRLGREEGTLQGAPASRSEAVGRVAAPQQGDGPRCPSVHPSFSPREGPAGQGVLSTSQGEGI